MILKGSQRGGARQLAAHLQRADENDHVEVAQLRGFVSDNMSDALAEAHAVSKGTRCKQFLFSLSVNPPKDGSATIEDMTLAIDQAEERLGLKGQPRVIVIHEKNGRRHAHAVWSRINARQMTAVNLPFFKTRLAALSKELYLEHGWELPDGHKENGWKSPTNFTLAEWQQAKRLDLHPKELKQLFQTAWKQSDNLASFRSALADKGYFLARGDQRGFVALDVNGEAFSVSRMTGAKSKDLTARLGSPEGLPGVEETRVAVRSQLSKAMRRHLRDFLRDQKQALAPLQSARDRMIDVQRRERLVQWKHQDRRLAEENRSRSARMRSGIVGLIDTIIGRTAAIRRQNEREAFASYRRDRSQREALFEAHQADRRKLQQHIDELRAQQRTELMRLGRQVVGLLRPAGDSRQNELAREGPRRGAGVPQLDM